MNENVLDGKNNLTKEKAREKLDTYAAMYGTLDPRTLEASIEVDKIILEEMKKIQKRKESSAKDSIKTNIVVLVKILWKAS